MDNETTERPSRWARLIPMIVLIICFSLAETALYIIALIQFIWTLVNEEPNEQLADFGAALSKWIAQDAKYLSYVTEEKPFPWAKWPDAQD
jgi:hypothetical protein